MADLLHHRIGCLLSGDLRGAQGSAQVLYLEAIAGHQLLRAPGEGVPGRDLQVPNCYVFVQSLPAVAGAALP